MGEEVVAVALEIVADEVGVVAVGDEADALGEERVLDLDLLQPDRALLARDLGKAGDLVDQFALADAPHVKANFIAKRQAVKDRGERKPDQRCGERAAENDDEGVDVEEHPEIAAHQDERDEHDDAGDQSKAGCDIHELPRTPTRPARPHRQEKESLARRVLRARERCGQAWFRRRSSRRFGPPMRRSRRSLSPFPCRARESRSPSRRFRRIR